MVQFDIDAEMYGRDPTTILNSALVDVHARWDEIEQALLAGPMERYNNDWKDEANGYPALSKADFLARVLPRAISVGEGLVEVLFDDGDIFSGHTISVTLCEDEEPCASLLG